MGDKAIPGKHQTRTCGPGATFRNECFSLCPNPTRVPSISNALCYISLSFQEAEMMTHGRA
eukprot:354905-Pyramimonas_sp.AAC.1